MFVRLYLNQSKGKSRKQRQGKTVVLKLKSFTKNITFHFIIFYLQYKATKLYNNNSKIHIQKILITIILYLGK